MDASNDYSAWYLGSESGVRVRRAPSAFSSPFQTCAITGSTAEKDKIVMNLFRFRNGDSANHKVTERALLLIPLVLVCFTLSPTARAADGGLPGFNTAEGVGALSSLTTGTANTG